MCEYRWHLAEVGSWLGSWDRLLKERVSFIWTGMRNRVVEDCRSRLRVGVILRYHTYMHTRVCTQTYTYIYIHFWIAKMGFLPVIFSIWLLLVCRETINVLCVYSIAYSTLFRFNRFLFLFSFLGKPFCKKIVNLCLFPRLPKIL